MGCCKKKGKRPEVKDLGKSGKAKDVKGGLMSPIGDVLNKGNAAGAQEQSARKQ